MEGGWKIPRMPVFGHLKVFIYMSVYPSTSKKVQMSKESEYCYANVPEYL